MRRLLLVVVLSTVWQQSGDTIPKELVTLLLRGPGTYPGENFEIRIGAPPGFPAELLPAGVKPAVSTVGERITTVIAEAPDLMMDALMKHERDLLAAGWISPSSMMMRGLMSSNVTPAMQVCKGDHYATIYPSMRDKGGLYIRVSLTTDPRRGSCVSIPRPMTNFADVNVPFMPPPANTPATGAGTNSGMEYVSQHVRLQTRLSISDVADHYARLLETSGWKRSSRAAGDGVVAIRLSSTSTTKEEIVALVTVVALADPSQQEVSLRLMRIDPNRRFPQVPAGGRVGGALTVGPGCC